MPEFYIPRVRSIVRLHKVPVPHTNEAVYALTADGDRWIAKREEDMGFEALLAEALSWSLAKALDAPVPDAALCEIDDERTWLSAWIPDVVHWSSVHGTRLEDPQRAGAVFALDLWVHNAARHSRNILLQPLENDVVRLWAIDADEALVGHVDDYIAQLEAWPSVHNHARGLPISAMAAGARSAAEKAARLPEDDLRARVEIACTIARESRSRELTEAVMRRARSLPRLLTGYLQTLETRG